jgi:hypothetical protein
MLMRMEAAHRDPQFKHTNRGGSSGKIVEGNSHHAQVDTT